MRKQQSSDSKMRFLLDFVPTTIGLHKTLPEWFFDWYVVRGCARVSNYGGEIVLEVCWGRKEHGINQCKNSKQ